MPINTSPGHATDNPARPKVKNFAKLLSAADQQFSHLVIAPDAAACATPLDRHEKRSGWLSRTWRLLCALNDYAASDATTFRAYLEGLPQPPVPPWQVMLRESDAVRSKGKYRNARTFAVPPEFDPSGRLFCEAHIRVEPGGKSPAPRLYYYEKRNIGKVLIAYVGPHLINSQTD